MVLTSSLLQSVVPWVIGLIMLMIVVKMISSIGGSNQQQQAPRVGILSQILGVLL
jgi:uncharacterized membrane protein affecting hemolysin expression